MSFQACADIVAKGDPDRFAAAMAAPVAARRVLFPLYAFNVEVSRAPWVTSEPMIGEMRLQWWRDALEEIGAARPVRRHEVTVPLAEVLHAPLASQLDELIAARRWDLYTDAFEDTAHFQDYLKKTGGRLMWVSAHLLGAHVTAAPAIVALGSATA
ncbi:MAG: squalene/phytoene synthase family protein, partial [Silicimonas sp.]|nr:squalene/phytoene synthase family protein [Silicimonas sp.]